MGEERAEAQPFAAGGWQRWLLLLWGSLWLLEVAEIILDALSTELEGDALQHSTAIQRGSSLSTGSCRVPSDSGKQEAKQLGVRAFCVGFFVSFFA